MGLEPNSVLGVMWISRENVFSDTWSYLGLAEGILHGKYNMWWELDRIIPDTLRAPGYPLLLVLIIKLFGSFEVIKVLNFIMYYSSMLLILKVIDRSDGRIIAKNIFLILLLPMIIVPYYIMQVYTDIPALFCISLVAYWVTRKGEYTIGSAIFLGSIFGALFQLKPVFVLLLFVYFLGSWLYQRRTIRIGSIFIPLVVFAFTTVPFGSWNLRAHNVFQVTPLQGGAGYMHFGSWAGKMPNCTDHISLRNFTGDEIFEFVPASSVPANIKQFEDEWA